MYIGKKLKTFRKDKDLTLVELSKKSGVQVATLSRMENNKMTGTLESHMALAKALNVDLPQLYGDIMHGQNPIDLKGGDTGDVYVHNDKSRYEMLTSDVLKKQMMPTLLTLEAGGETSPETGKPGSEKFIYVLEGGLEVTISQKPYILKKSHSLYFDGSLSHFFKNTSKRTTSVLIVMTPAQF